MPGTEARLPTALRSRRRFLEAAVLGTAATVTPLDAFEAAWASGRRQADACILIWLEGGLSHLDSFDPKPAAPIETRGTFRAIATRTPGLSFSEHLPGLAARQDRFAVLRGLDPRNGEHRAAERSMLSGHPFDPTVDHPYIGTLMGSTCRSEPIGPASLARECLAALRRIEQGARFAMVRCSGWDTHEQSFPALKDKLLPGLDQALSRLLDALGETGHIDHTLVAVLTEFGRAPTINREGGRHHNPHGSVALLAGAGIAGGTVVGRTDSSGCALPETAYHPEDLMISLTTLLGLDPAVSQRGRLIEDLFG